MPPTPREILKQLLQGIHPPKPLFLPIIFNLGAKIENTPLPAYLTNPTKITNAQRQIRTRLRSDGVSCYFDPNLEAEALGATIEWPTSDEPPKQHWPNNPKKGELPNNPRTPEEAANHPRVKVAVEVIQRLKSLLRDEPLLQAGISGPFPLAAHLTQQSGRESINRNDLPDTAVELAAATVIQVATKLAEAGAHIIFIHEEILPTLTPQTAEAWASKLAPAINIIRFYQALPVLQITNHQAFAENSVAISQQTWDCVLCPTLPAEPNATFLHARTETTPPLGIAIPTAAFQSEDHSAQNFRQSLHTIIGDMHPVLITTAQDVPATTDLKQLSNLSEEIHR
ncbi:MAG: uroporphyrinogen decarboxylase family protein [Candidatus Acidiferrales bacterium]